MAEHSANQFKATREDISEWYQQVLFAADILDQRFATKGSFVWKPYGFKSMNLLKKKWDEMFQEAGIEEYYFPLIVPVEYAEQNESWWDGFKDEGFQIVAGSDKKIQGVMRPTGEPAMYPMFKLWTQTEGDLPLRLYQTVNSYRYETKHTRPLIRDREITSWFEIHTAHATKKEAEEEITLHREFYDYLWEDMIALPAWPLYKPEWELFPGAENAIEYYCTSPTGRVMENGSINFLGQAYAKKFDITFTDANGETQTVWQVCTGNGARLLAAAILNHGDDKGLVLPPRIAPIQAVIVPIVTTEVHEEVIDAAKQFENKLNARTHIDTRDKSPGSKYYDWEIKGVPIRIEIGPRDLKKEQVVLVRRDTGEKEFVAMDAAVDRIDSLLEEIHQDMLAKARKQLDDSLVYTESKDEFLRAVQNQKVAVVSWCGSQECNDAFIALEDGLEGFGTKLEEQEKAPCVECQKQTTTHLYVGKTY